MIVKTKNKNGNKVVLNDVDQAFLHNAHCYGEYAETILETASARKLVRNGFIEMHQNGYYKTTKFGKKAGNKMGAVMAIWNAQEELSVANRWLSGTVSPKMQAHYKKAIKKAQKKIREAKEVVARQRTIEVDFYSYQ